MTYPAQSQKKESWSCHARQGYGGQLAEHVLGIENKTRTYRDEHEPCRPKNHISAGKAPPPIQVQRIPSLWRYSIPAKLRQPLAAVVPLGWLRLLHTAHLFVSHRFTLGRGEH